MTYWSPADARTNGCAPRQHVFDNAEDAHRECTGMTLLVFAVCANVDLGHVEEGRAFYVIAATREQAMGRVAKQMMLMTAEKHELVRPRRKTDSNPDV